MIKLISSLLLSSLFLIACTSKKNEKQLQAVIESFKNANLLVEKSNRHYLESIEYKTKDTRNYRGAQPALQRTENIIQLATKTRSYIEKIKKQTTGQSVFTTQMFDTLFKTRQAMLASIEPPNDVFSDLRKKEILHVTKTLPLFSGLPDSTEAAIISFRKSWANSNALGADTLMNQVILSKLENDLLITANRLIEHCHHSVEVILHCGGYFPIATISSSYVKTGDKIEVNVGMGEFDNSRDPVITINKRPMVLNADHVAVYTLKTKQAGRYTLPIQVEYTQPDGTKQILHKNFTYTVVD